MIVKAQDDNYQSLDSLQKVLQKTNSPKEQAHLMGRIAPLFANSTPERTIQMALKGATIAHMINDDEDHASCFRAAGWGYYKIGKADSAIYYLLMSINQFHQLHLSSKEATALLDLCGIYQNEDNDKIALGYLLKSIALFDSTRDLRNKAYAQQLIGISYRKLGVYDKAENYGDSSITGARQLKNNSLLADALLSKGILFMALKKWDSAFAYCDLSMATYKIARQLIEPAYIYEDKGYIYLSMNTDHPAKIYLDSAISCYQQAYNIFKSCGSESDEAFEQLNIGQTLALAGKYAEAKNYLFTAMTYFSSQKKYSPAYDATKALSDVYKQQNDYKNSLKYLTQSLVYKDSIDIANQKKTMADMLVKYETDKKDKAIQLLNTQKELSDKKLSRNRLIILFGSSIIILLVIIGLILRMQNRIRQRLKEVQMRNQIASDLHDDVGSSLSSILLLSNMAADFGSTPTEKNILGKIGDHTKEVIDKMADIVWTMKPGNDEGVSIKEKLEKLGLLINEISGIEVNTAISDKLESTKLDMNMRKNIFLLCKEAMNNIVKHANATCINFSLAIVQQNIIITINDNGKGFDKATTPANNGTETMLQRAIDCNGTCVIESVPGIGTKVLVTIPAPTPLNRYRFS
jgi:two-component system sensor histidine kinase UhpB